MTKSTANRLAMAAIGAVLVLTLGVTAPMEQEHIKISGKMTLTHVKQETMTVGDIDEHVLTFSQAEGTNATTGEHAFMDGAKAINMSFSDAVRGNGANQGYMKVATEKATAYAKWEGKVTTVISSEGVPMTTFEGEFSWIKGTGQFENIQGKGTFKGSYLSKTTYAFEWEGAYTIAK